MKDGTLALIMFAVQRAARTETDQDSPSARSILFGIIRLAASSSGSKSLDQIDPRRLRASFLPVGPVALSTFALTVASTATNVRIERPFVFPPDCGRREDD